MKLSTFPKECRALYLVVSHQTTSGGYKRTGDDVVVPPCLRHRCNNITSVFYFKCFSTFLSLSLSLSIFPSGLFLSFSMCLLSKRVILWSKKCFMENACEKFFSRFLKFIISPVHNFSRTKLHLMFSSFSAIDFYFLVAFVLL